MTNRDFYAPGDWNAVCSMCGRKRKASSLVKNWQGLYRCKEHNEPRQPQDFVRGIQELIAPPWVQPPKDLHVEVCTLDGQTSIPDLAIPDCMIPERSAPYGGYVPVEPPPPPGACTIEGSSSMPGNAEPGCSIPG